MTSGVSVIRQLAGKDTDFQLIPRLRTIREVDRAMAPADYEANRSHRSRKTFAMED